MIIIVCALSGLLIALVSIPLIKGIVPPNVYYGYRTAKTLSSDSIWYKANKRAGLYLMAAGILVAIASTTCLFFRCLFSLTELGYLLMAIMAVLIGIAITLSALYIRTL